MSNQNQIIIYQTDDGKISVDTLLKEESLWLSQKSMAQIFDCSVDNIALHLKNIFKSGELKEKSVTEDFSVTDLYFKSSEKNFSRFSNNKIRKRI
jgi:hypothetical protein